MSYRLLDSNGNYMEINGMHKGTIVAPYKYHGMELYNENAIATNRYPFYNQSWGSGSRRVKIGSTYYYPSGTTKKYVDVAYAATEITITGSYSSSSYKNYEVYKDGNLVASGSYTSTATDIYVCQKNANTSIIVSGMWDAENSKFIYNITTNATINRQNSYEWNNGILATSTFVSGTINDQAREGNIPRKIEMPTQEEFVYGYIPEDSIILSIGNPSFRFTFTNTLSGYAYNAWLRTDYDPNDSTPSTLPGSSVTSVTNLTTSSTKSSTVYGTSRFGQTYYLYIRQYGQSGDYSAIQSYLKVSCVITATIKYRYMDVVHTKTINVTRVNAYQMPKQTISNLTTAVGLAGTVTITQYYLLMRVKNNSPSGTYTYFRIQSGSAGEVVYGPSNLAIGSWTNVGKTYTADMPDYLWLMMSTSSSGTYQTGLPGYIAYSDVDGDNYIRISYTWAPPA